VSADSIYQLLFSIIGSIGQQLLQYRAFGQVQIIFNAKLYLVIIFWVI